LHPAADPSILILEIGICAGAAAHSCLNLYFIRCPSLMTTFDLLFVLVVFATIATLIVVVVQVLRGRFRQVVKIIATYGVCLAVYLGILIGVSIATPQRVLALGENRCFDDWCIAVVDIEKSKLSTGMLYAVSLRVSSRARRVAQREQGVVVYMIDGEGRRYEPVADPSAASFNVLLQPGQSVTTIRSFEVSGASSQLALVVGRQGFNKFPGIFIIGDDSSLFHKPMIVRIPG
jgi:hypothetical protein